MAEEIRKKEEETRQVRMVALAKQGASSRWEVPERSLSHNDLIKTPEAAFKFLVKSVYDLLPTPANKNTWFGTEEKCTLCGKEATLNHILTGCQVALAQGRYKWRHDQVLKTLTNLVEEKRLSTSSQNVSAGLTRWPTFPNKKTVYFFPKTLSLPHYTFDMVYYQDHGEFGPSANQLTFESIGLVPCFLLAS